MLDKFKLQIKEDYKAFLLKAFFILAKKLFSAVTTVCPNGKESVIILSQDEKLNEKVKNISTPSEPAKPIAKKRGRPKKSS